MLFRSVRFYRESVRLFGELSNELDYNILFENRGQLTLAHSDSELRGFRLRAEVNQQLGVRSELIGVDEIRRRVPSLDCSERAHDPILGGLWHADGATARHDAVVWGYAKAACALGVELHQLTEVTAIQTHNNAVHSIVTNRGTVSCGAAVQAVAVPRGQLELGANGEVHRRGVPPEGRAESTRERDVAEPGRRFDYLGARLAGAPVPTKKTVSRGIGMEGVGGLIAGVGGLGCAWARSTHRRCPSSGLCGHRC